VPCIGNQGHRAGEDAVDCLDGHEGSVERDPDGERAAEAGGSMVVMPVIMSVMTMPVVTMPMPTIVVMVIVVMMVVRAGHSRLPSA
jgi:hypothetical protein